MYMESPRTELLRSLTRPDTESAMLDGQQIVWNVRSGN